MIKEVNDFCPHINLENPVHLYIFSSSLNGLLSNREYFQWPYSDIVNTAKEITLGSLYGDKYVRPEDR